MTIARLVFKAVQLAALSAFMAAILPGPGLAPVRAEMRKEKLTLVTAAGETVINVEVAQTPQEKAVGLMFRTKLADSAGMLFAYGRAQEITMWMKNTYIPLDMVFIRADGIIHRVEAETEPFSEAIIASRGPVSAVLELAGGGAARLGLKPGDKIRHRLFRGSGN